METTTKPEAVTIRSFSDRPNTHTHTHTHTHTRPVFFLFGTYRVRHVRAGWNQWHPEYCGRRSSSFICSSDLRIGFGGGLLLDHCGLEGRNKNKRPFLVLSFCRVFFLDYDIVLSFSKSVVRIIFLNRSNNYRSLCFCIALS